MPHILQAKFQISKENSMTIALTAAMLLATPATTIPPHIFQGTFKYNDPQQGVDNSLLIGRICRSHSAQAAGATTTAGDTYPSAAIADHPGKIVRALVTVGVAPTAAATLTMDILINGTSIFASALLLNAASTLGVFDVTPSLTAAAQALTIHVGDVITMTRTYVAGGGTITYNDISLDWG